MRSGLFFRFTSLRKRYSATAIIPTCAVGLVLLVHAPYATAQTGVEGAGKAVRSWKGTKIKSKDPKSSGGSVIDGTCSIDQSATNPMGGACVNQVLVLQKEDHTEVEKARTNSQGAFSFETSADQEYFIVCQSKLYDVVAPKDKVKAGTHHVVVELKMK